MEAFVWLGAGRTDSTGSVWPDAGEVRAGACALPGFQLLVNGVSDELWRVEFDEQPKLGPDGLEGSARVVSNLSSWSSALAGAFRLQLFELARGTLARALVSVDSSEWPNAFSRDVMLDASQVGRKVATSRAPVELLETLEKVKPIVPELWPPQKKRGLFAGKMDATRVYELLRKALEFAIAAAEEITRAVNSPELIPSLNDQIAAASRLAKADLMFGAMLRASASSNQEAMEAIVEDARQKTKALREIDFGSGGHAGLSGGFSFTATDEVRSVDPDRGEPGGMQLPDSIKTLTAWLGDRLDITVAEIDLSRFEKAGAKSAGAASAGGDAGAAEAPVTPPRAAAANAAVEPLAAAAAEAARSVGEMEPSEPSDTAAEAAEAKPMPPARPAAKRPEPKPSPEREVVVVPNSPAGLESAAPGPTEPSAPERAAAAASAKQSPSRAYPPPLAAHTHDAPIWGQDDLLRHVEIIHGVPVGNMEPEALQAIHDATHAGD